MSDANKTHNPEIFSAEWERVSETPGERPEGTYRIKVPGGWVVLYRDVAIGAALVFLPDKDHKWQLEQAASNAEQELPF
jgi:hypothetical protein